jgi:hypothetical protein
MSSRRTYDTQIITIRQVNALNSNNSVIAAQRVLTTDGEGGTYWAVASNLGGFGALNELVVNEKRFVTDLSYNKISLNTTYGLGCIANSTTKEITLFSKGFDTIDISGGNTIYSYSNSIISPTFKFVGGNGVNISSDPLKREIYITGQPATVTGSYAYNTINVISNASTITASTIRNSNTAVLTALSPISRLSLAGIGDILLSTNITQNITYLSISSFTSKGYHDLSGVAYGTFSSCMSTVSSLFLDKSALNNIAVFVSTASLVSTTKELSENIARTDYNIQNNYTNKDAFNVLSNSVTTQRGDLQAIDSILNRGIISTVSFASSLNVASYKGILVPVVNQQQFTYTVSSVSFRLDSMSTMLNRKCQISLSYSPSLHFDINSAQQTDDKILYMSTLLVCGNYEVNTTTFNDTTFVRPWLIYTGTSNTFYNDTINMTFSSDLINNIGLTSSFTMLHRINNYSGASFNPGPLGFDTEFYTSGNNTLSVILTGTNYTSIN